MSSSAASENNTEDDYYSPNLIPLKIHDKLKEKDIVQKYAIDSRTANIVIELNHAYEDTNVNINIKDYPNIKKLRDGLENFLIKKKGVNKDDASILADVVDNNADNFNDGYYAYNTTETNRKEDSKPKGTGTGTGGQGQAQAEGEDGNSRQPPESEVILDVLFDSNLTPESEPDKEPTPLIHELFQDQYGTPYAAIRVNEHIETVSMRTKASSQMKSWISYTLYNTMNLIPKDESLNSVVNILRARATYEGQVKKLYLRSGSYDNDNGNSSGNDSNSNKNKNNEIFYDLTNQNWEYVKITSEGWSIEKSVDTPIFRRYKNQLAQVYPSKQYDIDIFDQFMKLLNIRDANSKLLLKIYIILLIYNKIQKPILAPYGEQGSAKSTLHEYIKQVIDPSAAITLAFPRDINELVLKLDQNYIAYFDNISKIPEWISDQLCRAVTGSGFSKRQLYTDEDAIICSFKRALGFNGINLAATKADLLDRCLIILLERIREDKRKPLENIVNIKGLNQELEKIKQQLLGYIFDILVEMLKVINTSGIEKPKELPRMADFAIHGEIVARCLGYDKDVFLNAFNDNIKLQADELLESNPLAMTIFQFIEWEPAHKFSNTATVLLSKLNFMAKELGIETDKFWPKGPGALSRRLNLIRTALRRIGVDIDFYEHTGEKGRSRGIKVCKISSEASVSSVTSDIDPNQARIHVNGSDDITDDMYDTNKISSEKSGENHAQNGVSDASDDTDDIFRTFGIHPEEQEQDLVESESEEYNNGLEECKRKILCSEFASLIGVKTYGPNTTPFYYCKLNHYPADKRVGTKPIRTHTIHFEMIEDHFRNVEPERHKDEVIRLSSEQK
jgi:hypothetical protein